MFFIRLKNDQKVTAKSINEDVFFGQLDVSDPNQPGVVLESVNNMLKVVFLKYLQTNNTWMNVPDQDLAAKIRHKFITSIEHYGEFLKGDDTKNNLLEPFGSGIAKKRELNTTLLCSQTPLMISRVDWTYARFPMWMRFMRPTFGHQRPPFNPRKILKLWLKWNK